MSEWAEVEFGIHQPMISGQDDAQERSYTMHREKPSKDFPDGRIWLVASQENAADNIYCEGLPGSDGFGGATLTFAVEGRQSVSLRGPWKTGADAFFKATGVDVRNSYLTRGIVALKKEYGKWPGPDKFQDVLHFDERPVLGSFDRIRDIAQSAANERGVRVFHASISKGGGHSGWADPSPSAQ